jgi:hypothetical protein
MGIGLLEYYADKADAIHANAFRGIRTLADWQRQRAQLHRQYLHSLGLERMPESTDPGTRDHGTLRGEGYTARKVSFRLGAPDCWGSGIVFFPDPLPATRNPAVLYLCGHSNLGIVEYHPHALMWTRRGYVCMIIDTIRQADNPGMHHQFSRNARSELASLGYTAAGGEFLNSLGALNVLCSLPEVDPARVGATGLSGGGAHCFFLAIADERVAAVASSCGVANLPYTLRDRNFTSNCDCMFWFNPYQRDTAEFGALIAPRPILFAHANGDYLFTPAENADLAAGIRRVYDLYGCPEKCSLFMFDGPHSYQPVSVQAINDWFDRHLAGRAMPKGVLRAPELSERQCSIFNGDHPVPDRLDILPELLTPPRSFPIPESLEELATLKRRVIGELGARVFHDVVASTEQLALERIFEWRLNPDGPYPVTTKYRGTLGGMELWITRHQPAADAKDVLVYVCERDEDDVTALSALPLGTDRLEIVTVEPRAGGLNAYNRAWETNLLKAGLYVGLSPVTLWIKDLKELFAHFAAEGAFAGKKVYLYGARDAGTAAIYYALMDDSVAGVIIRDIHHTHRVGGHVPGILKVLDVEQALGLLAPRLIGLDTYEWEFGFWAYRLYDRLGIGDRFVHTHAMPHTLARIFPR